VQCIVESSVSSPQPSPQLIAFVNRQIRNTQSYEGPERRTEQRQHVVLPVTVQPIDEQLGPLGQPLAMVTHNLSAGGVALVHEQPMNYNRVALRMSVDGEEVLLIGEIRWRGPLGPFNMCGCKVIAKLDRFPATPARVYESPSILTKADAAADLWHCPL